MDLNFCRNPNRGSTIRKSAHRQKNNIQPKKDVELHMDRNFSDHNNKYNHYSSATTTRMKTMSKTMKMLQRF